VPQSEAKRQAEVESHQAAEAEGEETLEALAEVEEEDDPTMTNTATGHAPQRPSLMVIFHHFYLARHLW